ncbi:MAG: YcnI family protein [Candidatus Taylorbacteria bacterium]|nr:YcnI family protein [Candidatus Taylorbacteria bacterium]
MIKKMIAWTGMAALAFGPLLASAHVTVKPAQVGLAAFQTFTVSVPNEKDVPTTAVRLVVPEGLGHVMPSVKPGWRIEVKKVSVEKAEAGHGDEDGDEHSTAERVSEIVWSGGSIPAGQRDEFTFSAQAPEREADIAWKAYQTYAGGVVVAWDMDPNAPKVEGEAHTPYSKTRVINDLAGSKSPEGSSDTTALSVALVALVLSVFALVKTRRVA